MGPQEIFGAQIRSSDFYRNWLPGPAKIRTFAALVNIILYPKPEFAPNGRPERLGYRYALTIATLSGPPETAKVWKETPLERAARFQQMLDSGQARNKAQLARLLGCSRAWVTKVLR